MRGVGEVQDYTKLAPNLRFADFQDPLKSDKMGSVFDNFTEKGRQGLPIYSVTLNEGMVPRNSLDRHMHADAAIDKNIRVKQDFLAYNMMRMWQGAVGIAPVDCMVSPAYVVLKPKSETCSEFFLQWYKNPRMLYLLWAYSYGLTNDRLRLYYKDFAQIPIKYPTLPEQKKIAAFLGAVDEKLAALRQRRDLLTRYKRGLMQKLFSQTLRFTRDDGTPFPDWEKKRLGDVCSINPEGVSLPSKFFYIDLESVKKGRLFNYAEVTRESAPSRAQRLLQAGDILFQTVRPYQKNNLLFNLQGDFVASTGYAQIRSRNHSKYLYQYLHNEAFVNEVLRRCTGTSYPAINSNDLDTIIISFPHPDEQKKIASALQAMDAKIDAVAAEIEQIETFKKALLQQMFV